MGGVILHELERVCMGGGGASLHKLVGWVGGWGNLT